MDLLIDGATLLTLDPQRRVLRDTSLLVRDGRIAKLGAGAEAAARAPFERVDARNKVLMPGLIQAHLHLCQTLFRNQADGLQLLDWLRQRIWPLEAAHDEASLRASGRLGIAELLLGGTTSILDMGTVRHTDVLFEVAEEAGFRLTCGKAHMDAGQGLPAALLESTAASLREAERLCKDWHGKGLLRYAFAPRFVLSCSDGLLTEVGQLARSLGARLHTHASENAGECDAVRERFGADNVEVLDRFGLTGHDAAFAHCVWLSSREQEILRDTGTHVVHCPSSNLKLASGIAKIPELIEAGVRVALGADGAPCNNNLDGFSELRLAALLHKPRAGPLAMPPQLALELATIGGARALGLEDELGSLEEGKRADLILLDLDQVHALPEGPDLHGTVVYSAQRADVERVWVEGRCLVKDGELTTLDEPQLRADARLHAKRLVELAL